VLLAEDNPVDVYLFKEGLRRCAIPTELCVARSGEEALKLLGNGYRPHIIFLDIDMPALAALEILQRMPPAITAPVVVFSNSMSAADKRRALKMGAREYVVKPEGITAYEDLICEVVKRWVESVSLTGTDANNDEGKHSRLRR
jgi:CheY-like chemotaxis protein